MNANELAQVVSRLEGKKREQDIAQIKETLRHANRVVGGKLYRAARLEPVEEWIAPKRKKTRRRGMIRASKR